MNKSRLIITLTILLLFLGLLVTFPVLKKRVLQKSISSNILYITQPVTSFSGTVEKIEGNTVTITQRVVEQSQIAAPLAAVNTSPFPTPKSITVTYRVLVTDKTQISQSAAFINYLFKTVTPSSVVKLAIKDVKVGQYVTVNSQTDLRTLAGNTFEATAINLPPIANTINGKIISLEGDILTIKGFPSMMAMVVPVNSAPVAPKEKEYRINITSDTEISRTSYFMPGKPEETPQPPKNEKLSASDLKTDMQVTVYTAEDVNETSELTALRIEPMQTAPNINPASLEQITPSSTIPSASASPSIKP